MNNKKANKIIAKSTSILSEDPKELLEKEKNFLNKPFFFEGTNGKGILLIHGWTTTPYELRRIGKYLNENGYTVYSPLLKGHGSVPKDLENVKWTDWMKDIEEAYLKLSETCSKVYVGGTSIGSCLAIILAEKNPKIAGFVLMATPYKVKFENIAIFFAKLFKIFRNYNRKHYPPTFGGRNTITRLIAYQTYSINSALEALKLIQESRKKIGFINQPCFVLQSLSDHIVTRKSLKEIYAKINSRIKKKKYIKRAYHTFISDIKNEHTFEEILDFLNKN